MKRIVGIVVALLLLASCAFAEGTTEKKNAFEFCDMYMQRLWEMKYERGLDATHDLAHYIGYDGLSYANMFAGDGQYYVEVPAGTLLVSVPDFSVIQLRMQLVAYNRSDAEKETDMIRAAVAFAALEYDRLDDYSYPLLHQIDPTKPENVMLEAIDIFFDAVNGTFNDADLMDGFFSENGNKIPFISGNYEYSLQYINGGEENPEVEVVYLIAECK